MNKTYTHEYLEKRARAAYEENVKFIKEHNDAARKGKYTFEVRANNMADLTQDGYLSRFIRLDQSDHPEPEDETQLNVNEETLLGSAHENPDGDDEYIPDAMDWRELGFKTGPLVQGGCGSCYAFSVATSIEGQIFRRTGKMVRLSVQQIIDCMPKTCGCRGGVLHRAFQYLKSDGGLMRDIDYPYIEEVSENSFTLRFNKFAYLNCFSNKNVNTNHRWPL